jgi:hypothetical protein
LRKGVDKTKDKEGKEVYGIMKKVERSEREGERERKRGVCMADEVSRKWVWNVKGGRLQSEGKAKSSGLLVNVTFRRRGSTSEWGSEAQLTRDEVGSEIYVGRDASSGLILWEVEVESVRPDRAKVAIRQYSCRYAIKLG